MNVDLDSLKWWGLILHRIVTASAGLFTSFILLVKHGEEVLETVKGWLGLRQFIDRQTGDRRHIVNVFEIPEFIKDVVQFANDVKAAEVILAPQFPQLIADAEKIKADGEKLLGIVSGAPTLAPEPPKAA